MTMTADRPATHVVPATSYSHPPPTDLPSSALRASLPNVQSWLDKNAPARTVHNTAEGTQQHNNYVVATTPKLVAIKQALGHQIDLATRHLVQSCPHNSGQGDHPIISSTTGAAQSNMDTATSTSPSSSHPPNPYEAWDPRNVSFTYKAAMSILKRWLTMIIFKRNLRSRLNSRKRVKHRSHVASVFLQSVLLPANVDNTSSATAPSPLFNTHSPRKQQYPTLAATHPFRQRGMTLPPLSSKQKRRCRRRCFRRYHQSRTRGTPRSKSSAQNHPLPTKIIHPTRACPHCPAFFHHQSDLDDHVILCKPVTSVASSDAPSPPVQVVSPSTSHVPPLVSPDDATSFPSSHPIHPTTPEGGAVKSTDRDPSTANIDWSNITANIFNNVLQQYPYLFLKTDSLQPYPNLSTLEDLQLMNQLLSALRQLPPSDLPPFYNTVQKRILYNSVKKKGEAVNTTARDPSTATIGWSDAHLAQMTFDDKLDAILAQMATISDVSATIKRATNAFLNKPDKPHTHTPVLRRG